jgi:uncharacterized protein with von Willebrand factor type A (vWA) domain
MLDVLHEFLWVLRREGFLISVRQAVDAAKAAGALGFADREALREALACVLSDSPSARARMSRLFDGFFDQGHRAEDASSALAGKGFDPTEVAAMQGLYDKLAADPRLAGLRLVLAHEAALATRPAQSALIAQARASLEVVAARLTEAFGAERSLVLTAALADEIDGLEQRVGRGAGGSARADFRHAPFARLSAPEAEQVGQALSRFAQRLAAAAHVRSRRRRRGRLDVSRTFRGIFRTGTVPLALARRDQRRDRPKLAILCDVSDSARPAARFLLELVHALAGAFAATRSFVFIGELSEVTPLFQKETVEVAIAKAASVVNVRDAPSCGRALSELELRFSDAVDLRTTVVILGDARSADRGVVGAALARLGGRTHQILWLDTRPLAGSGPRDAAAPGWLHLLVSVLPAACAADLEVAVQRIFTG